MNSVHEPGSRTMSKNRLNNSTESNQAKDRPSALSAQPWPTCAPRGDKHDILPHIVYESRCQGQLAGWLVSLTLEDEERPDLDLPRVVCEYVDVFPDELLGLPPQRVADFGIELHLGTSPISMTPQRMAPVELQELRVQLQKLLDKGFIGPSTSPWGALVLFV